MDSPVSPFIKVRKPGCRVTLVRRELYTRDELESFEKNEADGVYTLPAEKTPEKRAKGIQLDLDPDLALATALKRIELSSFKSEHLKGHLDDKAKLLLSNTIIGLNNIKAHLGSSAKDTIFSSVTALTAAICGVSQKVVQRVRADPPSIEDICQPKKVKSQREKNEESVRRLPYGIEQALKAEMQDWWSAEDNVTLRTVQEWMREEFGHELSCPTIAKVLHGLGYSYRVKTHNPLINTKEFVVQWKYRYVNKINECRSQDNYVSYFDETWLFAGMNPIRGWAYTNCDPYSIVARNGVENITPGPVKGNQKGQRAIVLAVLTEQGILNGSAQVLISGEKVEQQTMDYHRMMNTESFEEYMGLVLPLLRDEAVQLGRKPIMVLDNASYHCRPLQKLPTSASRKADLVAFLRSKGQHVGPKEKRTEIWGRVSEWIDQNGGRKALTTYWIDQFASNLGVELVRLPPYHCELNPIELVWSQLKSHLRSVGKSKDTLILVRDRAMRWLGEYEASTARKTIEHVVKKEAEISESITSQQLAVHTLMNQVDEELGDDFEDPESCFGTSATNPDDLSDAQQDEIIVD